MTFTEDQIRLASMALKVEPDWLKPRLSTDNPGRDLLPVGEAATETKMAKQTLYNWLSSGRLTRHKRGGKTFVSLAEIRGESR